MVLRRTYLVCLIALGGLGCAATPPANDTPTVVVQARDASVGPAHPNVLLERPAANGPTAPQPGLPTANLWLRYHPTPAATTRAGDGNADAAAADFAVDTEALLQQLREAASAEQTPALRARLWREYHELRNALATESL